MRFGIGTWRRPLTASQADIWERQAAIASRQVEGAELYLGAIEGLGIDDPEIRELVERMQADLAQLRQRLRPRPRLRTL